MQESWERDALRQDLLITHDERKCEQAVTSSKKLFPIIIILSLYGCDGRVDNAREASIQGDPCRSALVGDCDWYARCLEPQYPCGAEAYAIGYGAKYCARFSAKKWASPQTSAWVAKTRSCLQQSLIRYLDANGAASCDDIRHAAFASHPDCYTSDPDSFCYLDVRDITAIYFTLDLRERFNGEALGQMKSVIQQCLAKYGGGQTAKGARAGFLLDEDVAGRRQVMEELLQRTDEMSLASRTRALTLIDSK